MEFKNEKDRMLFTSLHPILIMIYADLYMYAREKHRINLVVTQTITTLKEDNDLNRKSPAHREGRAIDIRTRGIDTAIIKDLCSYINTHFKYKKYMYLTRSGAKRLAYFHNNGNGDHVHLAIHSRYKIDNNPLN